MLQAMPEVQAERLQLASVKVYTDGTFDIIKLIEMSEDIASACVEPDTAGSIDVTVLPFRTRG